jgi:hypothetical protein
MANRKFFLDDKQKVHPVQKGLADLSINIKPSEAANTIPSDADELYIIQEGLIGSQ